MNEHEMCCGTVADKAKLCAEVEQRDLIIAAQQRRISALQTAEDARARVAGRTLKFAMERGYNPASEENELEYIMRRFDEMSEAEKVVAAQQRRIDELVKARDAAEANAAALEAAQMAEWQAIGAMAAWLELKRLGMAQAGSKNVIRSLVLKLRQLAQEAGVHY